MKMRKIFLSAFLLLLSTLNLEAADRPSWADGFFADLEKSYIEVVKYSHYDLNTAKEQAMQQIIKQRSLATGSRSHVTIENGNISVSDGHDLIVKSRVLSEYIERHESGSYPYTVYLLVQTAKNPMYEVENVKISNGDYPFSGRVFVPGWAQFYKGQNIKGTLFITGEALFVGGIIASFSLKSYYENQIGNTHNSKAKHDFSNKANACNIAGYIGVGLAVSLYLWNIIDGAVSKGKPYIEADDRELSFVPVAAPDLVGLAMNFRF